MEILDGGMAGLAPLDPPVPSKSLIQIIVANWRKELRKIWKLPYDCMQYRSSLNVAVLSKTTDL